MTYESRESAPRPRHHGVLCTRTHTSASSLPKMSAGIPNPCAYIRVNQPGRAHAGRSEPIVTARLGQMVPRALGPLHAGSRNNHYGCPTIRKARPRDPVVQAKVRARWRPDVTARVPGPARVGFRAGSGNGHFILCDLLGCRSRRLRGIYTSSCKKAVINVSHSMSDAPPDQPHASPSITETNAHECLFQPRSVFDST